MKEKSTAVLKAAARSSMSGHYHSLVLSTFLFLFLDFISTGIPTLLFPAENTMNTLLQYALSFLLTLLACLIEAGYLAMMLRRLRGQSIAPGDLLYAFFHQADRYLLIYLPPVVIRYLLSIPGTLLGRYFANLYLGPEGAEIALDGMLRYMECVLLISLVISILNFLILLPLALIPYIAYDQPNLTPKQVYLESLRLMKGQFFRYLWLNISFLGIYLLAQLTFNVGSLWTTPYIRMTRSAFYMDRIGEEPYREMLD